MALNGFLCADVPLRTYTHSPHSLYFQRHFYCVDIDWYLPAAVTHNPKRVEYVWTMD